MGRNLELVREGLTAWLRGDVEKAVELIHPDIVSVRMPPIPDPGTYYGVEGIQQMYDDWTAEFGEFEMEPTEFIEAGDQVLVEMIQRGTGRSSGAVVVGRFWFVYTLVDGKVVRQDVYLTKEQALEST
jgi:ketosteroid isomerase-like protein